MVLICCVGWECGFLFWDEKFVFVKDCMGSFGLVFKLIFEFKLFELLCERFFGDVVFSEEFIEVDCFWWVCDVVIGKCW